MTFAPLLLAALLVQQPATPPAPALPASPIARLVITPEKPSMIAGDSLRIVAVALDSAGRPVTNATINYFGAGGRFEAKVAEAFEDPKYHKSWVEGQGEMFSPPTS